MNDTRGHVEGDRILVKTAALIREGLREIDTAARYGGEEFAILLPETSRAGAHVVADRIRRRVEERFRRRGPAQTVSGGVASYPVLMPFQLSLPNEKGDPCITPTYS